MSNPILTVGTRVRCERSAPPRGSWPRFAGRTGTIVVVNRRDGEYGVDLGGGPGRLVWFRPDELVPEAPKHAPHVAVSDENAPEGKE